MMIRAPELEIASVRAIYHFAGRKPLAAFFTTFKAKDIKCVVFSQNDAGFWFTPQRGFDRFAAKLGDQYDMGISPLDCCNELGRPPPG